MNKEVSKNMTNMHKWGVVKGKGIEEGIIEYKV